MGLIMAAVDPDKTLAAAYGEMRDLLRDIEAEFDQQLPEDFLPGQRALLPAALFRRIAQTLSRVERAHTPATIASELKVIVGVCQILVPDEIHRTVLTTARGALLMLGEEGK